MKNAAGYHLGPVTPSTTDGAPLKKQKNYKLVEGGGELSSDPTMQAMIYGALSHKTFQSKGKHLRITLMEPRA